MNYKEQELFGFDSFLDKDNSELDDTQITTTLLYYSQNELKEFKDLAKKLMEKHYPKDYKSSNISDLILKIFRSEVESMLDKKDLI